MSQEEILKPKHKYGKYFPLIFLFIPILLIIFTELGLRFYKYGEWYDQWVSVSNNRLMLNPKLLLLDEPSAGLSPKFISSVFETIKKIRDQGISILLVEQNATMALSISDGAYVLATGENKFEDTGKNLLKNPRIKKLYLGG